MWKTKFEEKYSKPVFHAENMWDNLKSELLNSFGRKDPYDIADNVLFLRSGNEDPIFFCLHFLGNKIIVLFTLVESSEGLLERLRAH